MLCAPNNINKKEQVCGPIYLITCGNAGKYLISIHKYTGKTNT